MKCNEKFLISRTTNIILAYDEEVDALDFCINSFEKMLIGDQEKDKYNLTNLFKTTVGSITKHRVLLINALVNIHEPSDVTGLNEKLLKINDMIGVLFNKKVLFYANSKAEEPHEKKLNEFKKMIDAEIALQMKILEEHRTKLSNQKKDLNT